MFVNIYICCSYLLKIHRSSSVIFWFCFARPIPFTLSGNIISPMYEPTTLVSRVGLVRSSDHDSSDSRPPVPKPRLSLLRKRASPTLVRVVDWNYLLPKWKRSGCRYANDLLEIAEAVEEDLDNAMDVGRFVYLVKRPYSRRTLPFSTSASTTKRRTTLRHPSSFARLGFQE